MTNLNAAKLGMNRFCGPAVLSILTGKSSDECALVISKINGNYNVTGVNINHLLQALDKLGFDQIHIKTVEGASLYRTLIQLALIDGMYVLWIGNHYVCVEVTAKKIYFCDNHTKEPIPAESSAHLGMKVVNVYRVIEREKPKPKPEPKLINTDYRISPLFVSGELFIDRLETWEDADENVTSKKVEIGYMKCKNSTELNYIIVLLKDKL